MSIFKRSAEKARRQRRPRNWRRTVVRSFKTIAVLLVVLLTLTLWATDGKSLTPRLTAILVTTTFVMSCAYLLIVAPKVHISFLDLDELIEKRAKDDPDKQLQVLLHKLQSMRKHNADKDGKLDSMLTLQVTRLDKSAALATVVNTSRLPVLHGELGFVLTSDEENNDALASQAAVSSTSVPFSLPARSSLPNATSNTFNHVGIFMLQSDGVRVFDLLGIFSYVSGPAGKWRVRVVPNIYRLARGIPESRKSSQLSEGIPDTPMDALDYDRVRDYRPGDSLRKIHWKLVAHRQGELYTKLFEDSRASSVTLLIDPYGPDLLPSSLDNTLHLHDTMLESGFSLIEHARENGLAGQLRFVNRAGSLVESGWEGQASLGWFVEVAKRPEQSQSAREQSAAAIQSLTGGSAGYVIFATSRLSERSVQALIASHHSGTPLLVVHAMPSYGKADISQQEAFDNRLRGASIDVISLTDGPQIIQKVVS